MKLAFIDHRPDYPDNELSNEVSAKEKLSTVLHTSAHRNEILNACKGGVMPFKLKKSVRDELQSFSNKQDTSLYIILLAVFKVMLYRYSSRQEITIGTLVNSNLLISQSAINGETSFITLLQQLRSELLPIAEVTAADNKNESETINSGNITFSEVFIFQDKLNSADAGTLSLMSFYESSQCELVFTLTDMADRLEGTIEYSVSRYDKEAIHAMMGHYVQLLESVLKTPDQRTGSLNMLAPEEKQAILYEFNDTITAYSNKKTITDLFEEQVEKTPENIALRQDNISISYLELNERANRLANYLVKLGVKKGSNVGLIAARSFNMIVGMYAIMKAGAAYVPIDPEYPIDRQEYILNNSSAELIISDSEYALGKKNTGFRVV
ncbi:MAG TPA: AMP-binding protein, partial [Sphingobacteriaceae bacterium]